MDWYEPIVPKRGKAPSKGIKNDSPKEVSEPEPEPIDDIEETPVRSEIPEMLEHSLDELTSPSDLFDDGEEGFDSNAGGLSQLDPSFNPPRYDIPEDIEELGNQIQNSQDGYEAALNGQLQGKVSKPEKPDLSFVNQLYPP